MFLCCLVVHKSENNVGHSSRFSNLKTQFYRHRTLMRRARAAEPDRPRDVNLQSETFDPGLLFVTGILMLSGIQGRDAVLHLP